jgi:hypothetical protein
MTEWPIRLNFRHLSQYCEVSKFALKTVPTPLPWYGFRDMKLNTEVNILQIGRKFRNILKEILVKIKRKKEIFPTMGVRGALPPQLYS